MKLNVKARAMIELVLFDYEDDDCSFNITCEFVYSHANGFEYLRGGKRCRNRKNLN